MKRLAGFGAAILLSGCGSEELTKGQAELDRHVAGNRVGGASDHWLEMRNIAYEWERVGLIFGYVDDYDACLRAMAGMKQANPEREFRCVPAN